MADAIDEVIHAIEVAEEGGLAAAGRTDECGDVTFGDVQVNRVQDLRGAIEKIELLDLNEATIKGVPPRFGGFGHAGWGGTVGDPGCSIRFYVMTIHEFKIASGLKGTGPEFSAEAFADNDSAEVE
jgi:hypothetical protein